MIQKTEAGFVFHLKARNGETVAVSQLYASLDGCYKGIESVIRHAAQAAVEDQTARGGYTPEKHPKFEIYRDKAGPTASGCSPATGRTSPRAPATPQRKTAGKGWNRCAASAPARRRSSSRAQKNKAQTARTLPGTIGRVLAVLFQERE